MENDYREALRRDPGLGPAPLGLAEELRKAHRTAEALEVLSGYLAEKPDDPAGYLAAGRSAAEQGDAVAAVGHLKRVLSLDPRSSIAYKELAELLTRQGDFSAALGLLDQAVVLDPFDIAIRHGRGIALARLGRNPGGRGRASSRGPAPGGAGQASPCSGPSGRLAARP